MADLDSGGGLLSFDARVDSNQDDFSVMLNGIFKLMHGCYLALHSPGPCGVVLWCIGRKLE